MSEDQYNPPLHCAGISLRNFRGFRRSGIVPLAPLTFFVGPNSSGKSSLADALLLIAQSGFIPRTRGALVPNWTGRLVDLGSFNDTVYRHHTKRAIQVSLDYDAVFLKDWWRPDGRQRASGEPIIRITFTLRTAADTIGRLSAIEVVDLRSLLSCEVVFRASSFDVRLGDKTIRRPLPRLAYGEMYFTHVAASELEKKIRGRSGKYGSKSAWKRLYRFMLSSTLAWYLRSAQRVSSGRAAPRRWYPLASSLPQARSDVHSLFDSVDPKMLREDSREQYARRRRRPRETLDKILRDLDIATTINDRRLSPYHSAIYVSDSITGVTSNLIDVGFGASQVIPVIEACLSGGQGPIVVEQPEIHLHPRAQGSVARLLCDTSRERQVIVETHSVHFINNARLLIAQGALPPQHVVVNYVYRTRRGSIVRTIGLDANGDFTAEWPGGFFDERYQDTLALLETKALREEQN